MTDLTVIILVGMEELHITRCLEKLVQLQPRRIVVVESQKGDKTHDLAVKAASDLNLDLELVFNDWPGNQAAQFNWYVDNHEIPTSWILRLDADEYLFPETIKEIQELLPRLSEDETSISMSRARRWFGSPIHHGGHDLWFTRMFRTGFARYPDNQVMDEHLEVSSGREIRLAGQFVDDSLIDFVSWQEKHRDYARREASAYWERRYGSRQPVVTTNVALKGHRKKELYDKLPLFFRAFVYFCLRYLGLRGFLDGCAGLSWNFWQGLWYRWTVDCEILKLWRKR